ncbi:MAG: hypothetical protein IKL88_03895 [Erysipelotrichales bacterium]|nr:hypothetical protein [Erysipelotrichales bacterium]
MRPIRIISHFILDYLHTHKVLLIALLVALFTMLLVPIDRHYIEYFDFRTLTCLFCTSLVISGFKNICIFEILARKIVEKVSTLRTGMLCVVFITFIGSMILANDMALLTFLPLGYFVLKSSGNEKHMAFLFIMQNIAANLGGMLTPFGNPQNLYLFSYYQIPTLEFMEIMFPPFITATTLIIILCLLQSKAPLHLVESKEYPIDIKKTILYTLLFIVSILVVFRVFPYYWGLIAITLAMFILDPKAFISVDYALLLTFCFFFIFAGNMARIPLVNEVVSKLISINPLWIGVASCQVMSNVPSSILLSKFTTNYPALLVAVNIGGCGTLIASLASLITFSNYKQFDAKGTGKYLLQFSLYNFSFLIILLILETFLLF